MDADDTVGQTVFELRDYIDSYATAPGNWATPYTSLVTSRHFLDDGQKPTYEGGCKAFAVRIYLP